MTRRGSAPAALPKEPITHGDRWGPNSSAGPTLGVFRLVVPSNLHDTLEAPNPKLVLPAPAPTFSMARTLRMAT